MSNILIGKRGTIIAGDEMGRYVEVEDDSENTGGYLILITDPSDFRNGHDDWVEDMASLEQYFEEKHWRVQWDI